MSVIHRMTGYDKRTELLAIDHAIPSDRLSEVRSLACVPDQDTEASGAYPLDPLAAQAIASKIKQTVDLDLYDWFFEPFSIED